jgi:hypothetical protein
MVNKKVEKWNDASDEHLQNMNINFSFHYQVLKLVEF